MRKLANLHWLCLAALGFNCVSGAVRAEAVDVAIDDGGAREPVDYVNTTIGTISHLLVPCFQTVQLPNGMLRFLPPYTTYTQDRIGPMMLQYPGHRNGGVTGCYPYSGAAAGLFEPWTSTWDQPCGTPYSFRVRFDTQDVRFSIYPTRHAALTVFDFRRKAEVHAVVFREGEVRTEGRKVVLGGSFEGMPVWIAGEFDCEPVRVERRNDLTAFVFGEGEKSVTFRYAVSYIDADEARRHLAEEVAGRTAEEIVRAGRAEWNGKLGKIEVAGGSEDQKTVFYTALWRTYERMVNITEHGRYRGWDRAIHETNGVDHYVDDWIWDTFRAHHPLMILLEPKAEVAKLTSYIRMANENPEKWMPTFPELANDHHCMINHHVAISFCDAWAKGLRGFDLAAAYQAMDYTERTESLIPWHRGPLTDLDRFHQEKGYFPALGKGEKETCREVGGELRQAVSVTLGASYDAWALAEIAKTLGNAEGEAYYRARAAQFEKLWDPATRFFRPRDRKGRFIKPFDPIVCGGHGARNYYTENNAWTYIWDVQHALPRLRELLGGAEGLERRLDEMLNTDVGNRWHYVAAMPDGATGLMGNFSMANEPSFHIPYLYNYAGRPEKTQKFIRKALEAWFRNDRMGICGDEDGGGMSAFAVFSMMGFYPVTPGLDEYQLGSPVFKRVILHLDNGVDFVISAPGASRDAKYWSHATIGGEQVVGTAIRHADILAGRRLHLEMHE